jgi:hypothetical protein
MNTIIFRYQIIEQAIHSFFQLPRINIKNKTKTFFADIQTLQVKAKQGKFSNFRFFDLSKKLIRNLVFSISES